jgi:hypothetical protein
MYLNRQSKLLEGAPNICTSTIFVFTHLKQRFVEINPHQNSKKPDKEAIIVKCRNKSDRKTMHSILRFAVANSICHLYSDFVYVYIAILSAPMST